MSVDDVEKRAYQIKYGENKIMKVKFTMIGTMLFISNWEYFYRKVT